MDLTDGIDYFDFIDFIKHPLSLLIAFDSQDFVHRSIFNKMNNQEWLLWQLADSALPTGGFIASNGLEVLSQLSLGCLNTFLRSSIDSMAASSLPVVREAHHAAESRDIEDGTTCLDRIRQVDVFYDACLMGNHVARRASLAQGAAMLNLWLKSFHLTEGVVAEYKKQLRLKHVPGHYAVVFAIGCHQLNMPLGID